MTRLKVMSVFGTRPEAVKMAPLVLELERRPELESVVCVTAQHREMLDSVLRQFDISPKHDLNIMQSGQSLADITSRVLHGMAPVYEAEKPGLVLVHGDTTTTFAAALAAFYAHFAPTKRNAENLRREGVEGSIWITGNTVIDALRYTASGEGFSRPELDDIDYVNHRVVTLTCHRRENYGQPMRNIFEAVRNTALRFPDVIFVYPVHLSPVVRQAAGELLSGVPNIKLIEPLDAVDMHRLMAKSYMVMTDSGGLQEEAPALGKPVLVLRRETERPEAVEAGTVELAGTERERIELLAARLLSDRAAYDKMAQAVNPYGDGRACPRIADAICYAFGLSDRRPEEFSAQ